MPTIRPYHQTISSQADIPGRRAGASDFSTADAQAGAGLQNLGASLYDMAERSEVSDAHARLATARAEWTVHLQERAQAAAPGDPNFASNFNQDLAKYLEKSGGYATAAGSRAYQQGSAELAAHFVQSAGVFQARSMGEKAKLDYGTLVNQNGLSVYTDPTQFDSLNKSQRAAIFDPSSIYFRVGGPEREKLAKNGEQLLARNALKGLINISPELAQKQLTEGTGAAAFIKAEDRDALDSEIKTAIRAKEIEAERARALDERAKKAEYQAVGQGLVAKLEDYSLTTKDILSANLPAYGEGSKYFWLQALRQRAKDGADEDKAVKNGTVAFTRMMQDVTKPPGTEGKLTDENVPVQAFVNREISYEDMNRARKEIQDQRTSEGEKLGTVKGKFFKAFEPSITQSNPLQGRLDPSGDIENYNFQQYVEGKIAEYKKANKDPYSLLTKGSPDYLGRPEVIAMFQSSTAQSLQNVRQNLRRVAPAQAPNPYMERLRRLSQDPNTPESELPPLGPSSRKAGETPAEYLKRTQK